LAANLPQLFSYLSLLDEFFILLITTGFRFLLKETPILVIFKDIKGPVVSYERNGKEPVIIKVFISILGKTHCYISYPTLRISFEL
jgi:hypothetical protein